MTAVKDVAVQSPKITKITKDIKIEIAKNLRYLTNNIQIEDVEIFNRAVTSDCKITLASDGGLRNKGGFGWVASCERQNRRNVLFLHGSNGHVLRGDAIRNDIETIRIKNKDGSLDRQ